MAVTAQELLTAINGAGIDTLPKATRVFRRLALDDVLTEAKGALAQATAQADQRAQKSAAVLAELQAAVAAAQAALDAEAAPPDFEK